MRRFWILVYFMLAVFSGSLAQPSTITLRAAAPFPFGAALNPNLLKANTVYRQIAAREFSSVTAENHLKMHVVHPEQDRYNWSGGDTLVVFAERNGQRIHGHTLLWHQAVPKWVRAFQGDSTAWEQLIKTHIQTVVQHYKGRIAAWDVVNEAFDEDGTLRKSIWLEHLGPDYIARCFRYAREADPAVQLFYNDYNQESSPKKLAAILAMVADFKNRGVPIDGIGLQMHTNTNQSDDRIETAVRQTAATGLRVHISELDVRINPEKKPALVPTDALLDKQKQKFATIVRLYKTAVPKAQQHGITIWNIGDGDSWIPNFCQCPDYPLPFDKAYAKKPAYDGILDGLK
ncbi:endo-1,4-beta-xylanase [Larkinella bovis]|uniref:Beta-xylanase n=1 Tax=Larkinella bovis TaxID=683041 RepID=A0ABW0I9N5_9BACT